MKGPLRLAIIAAILPWIAVVIGFIVLGSDSAHLMAQDKRIAQIEQQNRALIQQLQARGLIAGPPGPPGPTGPPGPPGSSPAPRFSPTPVSTPSARPTPSATPSPTPSPTPCITTPLGCI